MSASMLTLDANGEEGKAKDDGGEEERVELKAVREPAGVRSGVEKKRVTYEVFLRGGICLLCDYFRRQLSPPNYTRKDPCCLHVPHKRMKLKSA